MTHELKTWPEYFEDLHSGKKTFELRKSDRDFNIHDVLILKEWNPRTEEFTGRIEERVVTHILRGGKFGLPEDYCIMSLQYFLDADDLR